MRVINFLQKRPLKMSKRMSERRVVLLVTSLVGLLYITGCTGNLDGSEDTTNCSGAECSTNDTCQGDACGGDGSPPWENGEDATMTDGDDESGSEDDSGSESDPGDDNDDESDGDDEESDDGDNNNEDASDGDLTECDGDCESLSKVIAPMTSKDDLDFSGDPTVANQGPEGGKVLRFEGRGSGGFTGRKDAQFSASVNLSDRDIDLSKYDVLKLNIKASRGAFVEVHVDNVPSYGGKLNYWILDGLRGSFDWRTIYMDLNLPETIGSASGGEQTISISGHVEDTGRSIQGDDRKIWLGEFRAVKEAVHIDWDQKTFDVKETSAGGIEYTYPVEVTNKLDKEVTSELKIQPYKKSVDRASASLSSDKLTLQAGETKTVDATLSLPSGAVSEVDPLYTERFEVFAQAKGIADSRVTINRSSDPIPLPITVPLSESRTELPIFPTPDELSDEVLFFDEGLARDIATGVSPQSLIDSAKKEGIYDYSSSGSASSWNDVLVAAAYMYKMTGEQKFLNTASQLIDGAPEIWDANYEEYLNQQHRVVADGIIAERGDSWHYTLGLGWRLMGTQRSPYQYSEGHNSSGGSMSSLFYAFDMVASELEPNVRREFINEFAVPAGIQCRNHLIGDGNQQATVNSVALYAGMAAENWPLVAFAHSSQHSFDSVIKWEFTDDGTHTRDGYQTYALRPIFWNLELMNGVGVNMYDSHEDRLEKLVNQGFNDMYFWNWAKGKRL
jgi:hypothetical protein